MRRPAIIGILSPRQAAFATLGSGRMPTVYMVQADSQEECAAELARMCAAFDLRPLLPPTRSTGTERWLARAVSITYRRSPVRSGADEA
ncbi:hypothetical protein [Streptomyces sp. NBC_01590]|uniref:hypothetical protein n=1 Tax=Streptomyces sp. NBC_01590 TaxID=2975887 RepID=UPI00386F2A18